MLQESLIEFAKLVWDKDKMKDQAVNQVLSLEANKHHGKEADPSTIPRSDTDFLKYIGDKIEKVIEDKLGLDIEMTPVIEDQKAMEQELTKKYSDVSNKYNEILELVTASHQSIAQLMTEFNVFQSYMKEHVEWGETTEAEIREELQSLTSQVKDASDINDSGTKSVRVADLKNRE